MLKKILFFALFSILTSNAQEKFCVDRDSLFNVFSNYEELKIEAASLRVDTLIYRGLYKEQGDLILNLESEIENYKAFIIPKYQAIEKRQAEEIDALNRDLLKQKTNKWMIIGGSVVALVLASSL